MAERSRVIRLHEDVYAALDKMREEGEGMGDVVGRLVDEAGGGCQIPPPIEVAAQLNALADTLRKYWDEEAVPMHEALRKQRGKAL